jgi:hypothetical protein
MNDLSCSYVELPCFTLKEDNTCSPLASCEVLNLLNYLMIGQSKNGDADFGDEEKADAEQILQPSLHIQRRGQPNPPALAAKL